MRAGRFCGDVEDVAAPVVGAGIADTVEQRAAKRALVGVLPLQGQGDRVNGYGILPFQIAVGLFKKALAEPPVQKIAQASGNHKVAPKVHMHICHAGWHDQSPLKIVRNFILAARLAFKPPAFVRKADHVRLHGCHAVHVVFKPKGEQGGHKRAHACSRCAVFEPLERADGNHHELGHVVQGKTPALSRQFDSAPKFFKLCQNMGRQGGYGGR